MTEQHKSVCVTSGGIMSVHNLLMSDLALTVKEFDDIWKKVRESMSRGVENPVVSCSDEFDLKSMVAGSIIITGLICAGMDAYKVLNNASTPNKNRKRSDIYYQNASYN